MGFGQKLNKIVGKLGKGLGSDMKKMGHNKNLSPTCSGRISLGMRAKGLPKFKKGRF
jgi:hypothetical protein